MEQVVIIKIPLEVIQNVCLPKIMRFQPFPPILLIFVLSQGKFAHCVISAHVISQVDYKNNKYFATLLASHCFSLNFIKLMTSAYF